MAKGNVEFELHSSQTQLRTSQERIITILNGYLEKEHLLVIKKYGKCYCQKRAIKGKMGMPFYVF